ncbi:MAG: acyl-CoA dehydrogenase family protein [Alteromonadaceae bacterium]|nr:acyl-CoA dehydrogenase family protein [Alteromonadaceae bacterium]
MILTQEHLELKRTIANFVENEINPYVDEWERSGIFPAKKLFKKMGGLGLLGISKPVENGGMGLDYSYEMIAAEEFGAIRCGGVPMAIGVQTNMATPALAQFGSEYVRETYLAPAIAGDMIACIGVSEPGAGSDVAAIKTTAIKEGDYYVINGTKMWITNATQADFICLLANTSSDSVHKNKSLIVVPTNTPGISFSEKLDKLGMRSSDTAQIFFDDVRVSQKNLIGREGAGFIMQMQQFQEERLYVAAMSLKSMETCINETLDYTQERQAFGKPLLANQVIRFRLAELQSEVEALRALIYQASEQYINGENVTTLASMAKLKSGRLSREVSDACLQYWGGMGFMWDNIVSRFYRDNRLGSIGGGADEIMLSIISKHMALSKG